LGVADGIRADVLGFGVRAGEGKWLRANSSVPLMATAAPKIGNKALLPL